MIAMAVDIFASKQVRSDIATCIHSRTLTDKAEHGRTDPSDIVTKVEQTCCEGRERHGKVEPREEGTLV